MPPSSTFHNVYRIILHPTLPVVDSQDPYHRGLSDQRAAQMIGMPIALQFSNEYTGLQGAILDEAQYPSALASATAS